MFSYRLRPEGMGTRRSSRSDRGLAWRSSAWLSGRDGYLRPWFGESGSSPPLGIESLF
jgi:hypothetical protein